MNETPIYTNRLSGRRAMTVFALGASVAMLAFGVSYGAPWYFMAPVGVALAMLVWLVMTNPQSGSVLTRERLTFFNRNHKETVLIVDVAHMKVSRWSDGPDTVALTLKSGEVVHVPSLCADSKLAVALRELGVRELASNKN